jgi:hypothetical protein
MKPDPKRPPRPWRLALSRRSTHGGAAMHLHIERAFRLKLSDMHAERLHERKRRLPPKPPQLCGRVRRVSRMSTVQRHYVGLCQQVWGAGRPRLPAMSRPRHHIRWADGSGDLLWVRRMVARRGFHYGWVLMVPMAANLSWSISELSGPLGLRFALFGLVAPVGGALEVRYGRKRSSSSAAVAATAGSQSSAQQG